MTISIIIPTLNEAPSISRLLDFLLINENEQVVEIIVVDGGSNDDTMTIAARHGVVVVASPKRGRAAQMNFGASLANGELFYFIHADTLPAAEYATHLVYYAGKGYGLGRYQTRFDKDSWLLKLNAFFTRFDLFVCYGGDQTLFVRSELFRQLNGFDENLQIMEEYEFVTRARKVAKYKIMPAVALVSARKYQHNSWFKVQQANYAIVRMYRRGAPQSVLLAKYDELMRYK